MSAVSARKLMEALEGFGSGPKPSAIVMPADFPCLGTLTSNACPARLPRREQRCPSCVAAVRSQSRSGWLAPARASLAKAFPWARFGDPTFEAKGKPWPDLRAAARAWRPGSGWMVMLGPSGASKTAHAVAIARGVVDRAALDPQVTAAALRFAGGVRFVKAHALATAWTRHPKGAFNPELADARDATLLVIDELGYLDEQAGTIGMADLRNLIDARYDLGPERNPTIVTSGLSETEFWTKYGAAGRRLRDLGQVIALH